MVDSFATQVPGPARARAQGMIDGPGTTLRVRSVCAAVALAGVLATFVLGRGDLPHPARVALGSALLGTWAAAALGVGARLARRADPDARPASALLAGALWSVGFLVALLSGLGALGLLARLPVALALGAALVLAGPPRLPDGLRVSPQGLLAGMRREPLVSLLVAGALLSIGLLVARATLNSIFFNDDLSYHAAAPLEWIQRGTLARVHPPFGNHSPAYYPKGNELLYAWALLAHGDLGLLTCAQGLARALLALAVAALARELGAGRPAVAALVGLVLLEPSSTSFLPSLYGDVSFAACTVAAVWALVRLRQGASVGRGAQLGLAVGLLLGTKVLAVFYVAVVLTPLAVSMWLARPRAPHARGSGARSLLAGAAALGVAVAVGGWWYLRNWIETGNPLFPLLVEFGGRTVFDGAYDQSDLPYGDFEGLLALFSPSTADPRAWVHAGYLAPFALGIVACAARARREVRARAALGLGLALPLWIAFAVVSWVPFGYPRFCLAAQALIGLPLAIALEGRALVRHTLAASCLLPLVLTLALGIQRAAILETLPMRALESGPLVSAGIALGFAALVLLLALAALRLRVGTRRVGLGLAASLLLACAQIASRTSHPGSTHAAQAVRELWAPYLALEERGDPLRIATTGTTWLVFGYGWRGRNHVEYVHVDALGQVPFHERVRRSAARRDELRSDRTGFGYYREGADPEAWIANLRSRGIQVVVCARMPPWIARRPEYARDAQGFPPENAWAEERPQLFRRLDSRPNLRVYEFLGT